MTGVGRFGVSDAARVDEELTLKGIKMIHQMNSRGTYVT